MQIRKLANTLAISLLCSLSLTMMSFTDNGRTKARNSSKKDSSTNLKNSQSIFDVSASTFSTILIPLNPNATSFVSSYLKREGDDYTTMKKWGKTYFDLYDRILTDYNIPCLLKYLSVIESSLQSSMVSSAGAVGPWQIMPDEAKKYGLKTGKGDERKDYSKSTVVAAKLLNGLYKTFGDWLLVIAAYNAGAGRVKQAINKAHSTNFWLLQGFLPEETRNHVKKFIATHYFFEGGGSIATMTADEIKNYSPLKLEAPASVSDFTDTRTVEIQGKYNSTIMAKYLQMDNATLSSLNPRLDEALNQGGVYNLRLPSEKINLFEQTKKSILKESVQLLLASDKLEKNNIY